VSVLVDDTLYMDFCNFVCPLASLCDYLNLNIKRMKQHLPSLDLKQLNVEESRFD